MPSFLDVIRHLVHSSHWTTEEERNQALAAVAHVEDGGELHEEPPTEEERQALANQGSDTDDTEGGLLGQLHRLAAQNPQGGTK